MNISRCDLCEKIIEKDEKSLHLALGKSLFSNHKEICVNCGEPVLHFLEKNQLIQIKSNSDETR